MYPYWYEFKLLVNDSEQLVEDFYKLFNMISIGMILLSMVHCMYHVVIFF
jgi:hypothetical protein